MALVTEQGYKASEAAWSLEIVANLLRRWKREFEAEVSGERLTGEEREELRRLRKENRILRMEKEVVNDHRLKAGGFGLRLKAGHFA